MCNICCIDKDTPLISCYICGQEACDSCHGRFIMGTLSEPQCLHCLKTWSREFVLKEFSDAFIKREFLPHMGKVLLEKEKDLLPGAMKEAATLSKIATLNGMIKKLPTIEKLKNRYTGLNYAIELGKKRDLQYKLRHQINELKKECVGCGERGGSEAGALHVAYKCTECRGFVTIPEHKCGMCSTVFCSKCRCVHDGSCDPNILKNVQSIEAETRACPKCYVPIFKNGGCDQMFCTECKTVFSYKTGHIESGNVHNPLFYEWLARNPEGAGNFNLENIACGELPNLYVFNDVLQRNNIAHFEHLNAYRFIVHMREIVLPTFQENLVKENFDLRVAFLMGEFDEEKWAMKLINRERRRMKQRAFRDLLDTGLLIITDMMRQLMFEPTPEKSEVIMKQYGNFSHYFWSSCFENARIYGGEIPKILKDSM